MKIELAHDILAKSIYEKASSEDKMRIKIHELLQDRLVYYKDKKILLNKDDLRYIAPFLHHMELEPIEEELIEASKQRITKINRRYLAFAIIAIILLIIFNFIANRSINLSLEYLEIEEKVIRVLSEEDSLAQLEVKRADSILTLQSKNPEFTKKLLESYDTLQIMSKRLLQEKNIAQSSTLSSLAEVAFEQNKENPEYAFKLAAKSWELNHKNKLACDVLYKIHQTDPYSEIDTSTISHDQYIENLIFNERSKNGWKNLSEKDMAKIFDEKNLVVQDKKEGVQERVDKLVDKRPVPIEQIEQKEQQIVPTQNDL